MPSLSIYLILRQQSSICLHVLSFFFLMGFYYVFINADRCVFPIYYISICRISWHLDFQMRLFYCLQLLFNLPLTTHGTQHISPPSPPPSPAPPPPPPQLHLLICIPPHSLLTAKKSLAIKNWYASKASGCLCSA